MGTYNSLMGKKLGLNSPDTALVNQLLTLMARSGADWTNTFRALAHTPGTAGTSSSNGSSASSTSPSSTSGSSETPAAAEAAGQEGEQFPTPGAAVEAALAAGLPQQLVDALTADALAEEGPALVEEWATWLRLWRARLAEEGMAEEVGGLGKACTSCCACA